MSQPRIRSNPQNAQIQRSAKAKSTRSKPQKLKEIPPQNPQHTYPNLKSPNIPLCPICLFLRDLVSSWQESALYKCRASSTNRPRSHVPMRHFCKTNPISKNAKTMQIPSSQSLTTQNHPQTPRKNKPNSNPISPRAQDDIRLPVGASHVRYTKYAIRLPRGGHTPAPLGTSHVRYTKYAIRLPRGGHTPAPRRKHRSCPWRVCQNGTKNRPTRNCKNYSTTPNCRI